MRTLIYDFGMNNGDDTEYYLAKGASVVGVEANPVLCRLCEERFANYIAERRLVVVNVALSGQTSDEPLTLYVHKKNHVLSQVPRPDEEILAEFDSIQVPQRKASDIVGTYGAPHYIKIDVEGMDHIVLRDLLGAGIVPDFISAEAHSAVVFALLVSHDYDSFSLVDGATVQDAYGHTTITTPRGSVEYSFKKHSAGPYGEDIVCSWWDSDTFVYVLASEKLGWKDIHASRVIEPNGHRPVMKQRFREHLRDLIPSLNRAIKDRRRAKSKNRE